MNAKYSTSGLIKNLLAQIYLQKNQIFFGPF